jgi:hypothetical protein
MPPPPLDATSLLHALLTSQQAAHERQQQQFERFMTSILEKLAPATAPPAPPAPTIPPPTQSSTAPPLFMQPALPPPAQTIPALSVQPMQTLPPLLPMPVVAPRPASVQSNAVPIFRNSHTNYPSFSGTEPSEWLFQTEKYFRYYHTTSEDKLAIAAMHLNGEANRWYQGYENEYPSHTWDDFKRALVQRFGAPGVCGCTSRY